MGAVHYLRGGLHVLLRHITPMYKAITHVCSGVAAEVGAQ